MRVLLEHAIGIFGHILPADRDLCAGRDRKPRRWLTRWRNVGCEVILDTRASGTGQEDRPTEAVFGTSNRRDWDRARESLLAVSRTAPYQKRYPAVRRSSPPMLSLSTITEYVARMSHRFPVGIRPAPKFRLSTDSFSCSSGLASAAPIPASR